MRLGPSHLERNALLQEPFSTSAIKILTQLIATPTKICTSDGSSQSHLQTFYAHHHALLLIKA